MGRWSLLRMGFLGADLMGALSGLGNALGLGASRIFSGCLSGSVVADLGAVVAVVSAAEVEVFTGM